MDNELDLVVFEDDDGNELTMEVLDYLFYEGKEYALLTEYNEDGYDEAYDDSYGENYDDYGYEEDGYGEEDEEYGDGYDQEDEPYSEGQDDIEFHETEE